MIRSDESAMWDRRYGEQVWTTEPDPVVVAHVASLQAGRAVDLGCGTGRHAMWLAQHGWTVTGVDASVVGLEQAAARAAGLEVQLTLVRADIADYQPPPEGFDLVLLAYVHPAPDHRAATVARASRALAPGGRLLVVGHDLGNLGRDGPPDPARLFTVDRLRDAVPRDLVIELLQRVERSPATATAGLSVDAAIVAILTRPVIAEDGRR